jgi:carboxymethylenebutenolidase
VTEQQATALTPLEREFILSSPEAETRLAHADFSVFEARPAHGAPIRGGVIVIQEIFGVNPHIRDVARDWAKEGYIAWAPAYFDHIEKNIQLTYEPRSFVKGRQLVSDLGWDQALEDTEIAARALRLELANLANSENDQIAAIGFCWGGSLAWLAACRLPFGTIDSAVAYYGRATHEFRFEKPLTPAILHFGAHDPLIPIENVNEFMAAQPNVPVHIYDAGHGFNCDHRQDFNSEAAESAKLRTKNFLMSLKK